MAKLYPVVLMPIPTDEGGGFMAYAPDLKGCMSHGDTEEEALANVKSAVDEWIDEANNLGKAVPDPGSAAAASRARQAALKRQFEEQQAALQKLGEDVRRVETIIQDIQAAATAPSDRTDVLLWTSYVAATSTARDKGSPEDFLH